MLTVFNNNDRELIDTAVFALGSIKNQKTVEIISKYKDTIEQPGLIKYYCDMNFNVINKMMDKSNEKSTIINALSLIEIGCFKEFWENVNILTQNNDSEIRTLAEKVKITINNNNFNRNSKWDN